MVKNYSIKHNLKFVRIPSLHLSALCPVASLRNVFKIVPNGNMSPLFQVGKSRVLLTDSKIKHHFSVICKIQVSTPIDSPFTPSGIQVPL